MFNRVFIFTFLTDFLKINLTEAGLSVLVLTCLVHPEFVVANTPTGNILGGGTRAYLIR